MKGMLLASHIHFFMPSVTPNTFYCKGPYIPQGHQYLYSFQTSHLKPGIIQKGLE